MPETILARDGVQAPAAILAPPVSVARPPAPRIPAYLEDHYWWAYLRPASVAVFDHVPVVSAILWGQYARLKRAALSEIPPGGKVLQAACVYGDLSPRLAGQVGETGSLDVVDIVPLQVDNCRHKLVDFPHAVVRLADAAAPGGGPYDAVLCFFLLHELPEARKRSVVDALLACLAPGGKAIFVDYHKPHPLHPLGPVQDLVFRLLEPFAKSMWLSEIAEFAGDAGAFRWRKQICFGGLFQKVVAEAD